MRFRLFRRSSPVAVPLHLAVTVAGEPACVVDLGSLLYGHVSAAPDPSVVTMQNAQMPFPGRRPDTRMWSLLSVGTDPAVGIWVGNPGAFDAPENAEQIS